MNNAYLDEAVYKPVINKASQLADWFTFCGTSFRMVLPDAVDDDVDEAPFEIYTLDPRYSFAVSYTHLRTQPHPHYKKSEGNSRRNVGRLDGRWKD